MSHSFLRTRTLSLLVVLSLAACSDDAPSPADPNDDDPGAAATVDSGKAPAADAGKASTPDASKPDIPTDLPTDDAEVATPELPDATTRDAGAPDSGARDPGTDGDGDITIGTFTTQPELTDRGAPRGKSFRFSMDSTKSQIFDGKDKTLVSSKPRLLKRQIDVYVPARYKDGTPAPILVIQDGPGPFDAISRALDNLTSSSDPKRKVPAFIAIAVQNGGDDAQGSERGLEYDTLSDRYARFIELEVLPAVLANSQIKAAFPKLTFTSDPEGRATYGCSSGGAAAFTMAWFRPDLFRRAITYSGTFVAQQNAGQPESPMYPLGAWEYHSSKKLIENTTPNKPVRVFLNVNEKDIGATAAESGHHNWVLANQRMAAVFKAKGYHYRFVYAKELGHCDGKAWQSTLADTLVWTWAGYPTD